MNLEDKVAIIFCVAFSWLIVLLNFIYTAKKGENHGKS